MDDNLKQPDENGGTGAVTPAGSDKANEIKVEENKVRVISPGRMVMKRFFRSKLSVISLSMLAFLFLFAFVGPMLQFLPFIWRETQPNNSPGEPIVMQIRNRFYHEISGAANIEHVLRDVLGENIVPLPTEENPIVLTETVRRNHLATVNSLLDGSYGTFTNPSGVTEYFIVRGTGRDLSIVLGTRQRVREDGEFVTDENNQFVYEFVVGVDIMTQHIHSIRDRSVNSPPSRINLLGTDSNTFDIFTRLMYGGRISLTIGFVSVFISMFFGILFGGLSGYFGKWVDNLIMRIVDILACLPGLPMMMVFSAILDGFPQIEGRMIIYIVMGGFALIGWGGIARFVRGQILTLREHEFMVATEALGLPVSRRIIKHLVPNVMPLLIVGMVTALGTTILSESSLSFLGLGVPPPYAAWGSMIAQAQDPVILRNHPNQWIPAGVLIAMSVLAFGILGDGLRDAFDPKSKR